MPIVPYLYPMSSRDPYPFPRLENDDNFRGRRYSDRERHRLLPTHTAHTEEPWNRINRHHTLSSMRHEVCYVDPQAPAQSLDFVLKALYDHGKEFLKDKNEVLHQRETLGVKHSRILKNRTYHIPVVPPELGHPLRVSTWHRRDHPSTIKTTILGHHMTSTNPGYSRKSDWGGTIYTL